MGAYVNFHLNRGRYEGSQIIPANVMSWLYKSNSPWDFQTRESETDRLHASYGYVLGLELRLYDGYKLVNHGGYWPPYNSGMNFIPALNIGLFSATNGPGLLWPHDSLHYAILDIFQDRLTDLSPSSLAKYYTRSPERITQAELEGFQRPMTNADKELIEGLRKVNGIRARVALEDLVGSYGNANSSEMQILINPEDGRLRLEFGKFGIGKLNPTEGSETVFVAD